jgi:endonuclease III
MDKIEVLLANFRLYAEDLGIDLKDTSGRFKWFLASILYGARISEKIASNTYKSFEWYGIDSPEKIIAAGWDELVRILDEGGYVRYDFSTATKLLDIAGTLKEKYGSLENLYNLSSDTKDLERRLREFKGIGAVTTQIFLRELRGVWQINPEVSDKAKSVAENLDTNLQEFEGEKLSRVETALVKLGIKYCKRKRCEECPVKEFCEQAVGVR